VGIEIWCRLLLFLEFPDPSSRQIWLIPLPDDHPSTYLTKFEKENNPDPGIYLFIFKNSTFCLFVFVLTDCDRLAQNEGTSQ
jgi:hypothetical protein